MNPVPYPLRATSLENKKMAFLAVQVYWAIICHKKVGNLRWADTDSCEAGVSARGIKVVVPRRDGRLHIFVVAMVACLEVNDCQK